MKEEPCSATTLTTQSIVKTILIAIPLTIQNEAMNNFIRLTSIKNPHIIPITSDNIQFKLGDNVVVTEGKFKGIHGRVARIAGQQRVVVELFEGYLVATAYIPKDAIKIIND